MRWEKALFKGPRDVWLQVLCWIIELSSQSVDHSMGFWPKHAPLETVHADGLRRSNIFFPLKPYSRDLTKKKITCLIFWVFDRFYPDDVVFKDKVFFWFSWNAFLSVQYALNGIIASSFLSSRAGKISQLCPYVVPCTS